MANPVGRPTVYDPKYCDMLIEHMARGYSFESFAGFTGHSKQTLYEWAAKFEEFGDAKSQGTSLSRLFWERLGIEHILNINETEYEKGASRSKSKSLNSTVWIFNMKNRFGWRDKQPDEEQDKRTDEPMKVEVTLSNQTPTDSKEVAIAVSQWFDQNEKRSV